MTIFSAERGLQKAVAKGSRRPGTKMAGRSDVLCVNELHLASGKTFAIITQAQSVESFSFLRSDLFRLSYGLYYAELTTAFGEALSEEKETYFEFLLESLKLLGNTQLDAIKLCMEFEFGLLDFLGYTPELTFCISCREPLDDYTLSRFVFESGGIVCSSCFEKGSSPTVRESPAQVLQAEEYYRSVHITPLVWKTLILRANRQESSGQAGRNKSNLPVAVLQAAQRIMQSYIEQRANKHFKSLDILSQFESQGSQENRL